MQIHNQSIDMAKTYKLDGHFFRIDGVLSVSEVYIQDNDNVKVKEIYFEVALNNGAVFSVSRQIPFTQIEVSSIEQHVDYEYVHRVHRSLTDIVDCELNPIVLD